jgi:hypothetical protein
MIREPDVTDESVGFHRPHVNSALLISVQSVVWTVVASTTAVALGIHSHTAVLVAFGAIGIVDAVGSIALAYHFHHGLRHDELSEELERFAHRVVLIGLFSVGCAAIIGGLIRLMLDQASDPSYAGVALAAASLVALIGLSARKQQVARRVSSKALRSDGHLSAIGAMQAAVTVVGTATALWLGWRWADAAATTVVGSVAAILAISTWRADHRPTRAIRPATTWPIIALLSMVSVASVDAVIGARLILIGLLVAGPVLASLSLQLRPIAAVGAAAVVLAVALGAPDGIWLSSEHAVWIAAVALVAVTDTALIAVVAPHIRRMRLPV